MRRRRAPIAALAADDVAVVYRELLGREATAAEIAHQCAAAPSLRALLDAVLASPEYHAARGAAVPASPPPAAAVVNVYTPELEPWGFAPGTWSADGVALVGHAGWLFLGAGSNAILDQYRGDVALPDGWVDDWAEAMAVRRGEAEALGAAFVGLIVPDKLPVLGEHFPGPLPSDVVAPAARLAASAELDLLYPVAALRAVADGAFLRTDTHFTYAGNAVLARVVGERLGLAMPTPEDLGHGLAYVTSGDLGSRFSPPVVEVVRTAGSFGAAAVVADNRAELEAVGGNVGTRQVLENATAPDPRTVVVFGDSYAFAAGHYQGLAWFLAQVFRCVHFVWVPFGWDPAYVERAGAEVVVCEGAERFAVRPPAPRVDAEALAAETIARLT